MGEADKLGWPAGKGMYSSKPRTDQAQFSNYCLACTALL